MRREKKDNGQPALIKQGKKRHYAIVFGYFQLHAAEGTAVGLNRTKWRNLTMAINAKAQGDERAIWLVVEDKFGRRRTSEARGEECRVFVQRSEKKHLLSGVGGARHLSILQHSRI